MSTLALIETEITLTVPCGCSFRRVSQVDPKDGSQTGETVPTWCPAHALVTLPAEPSR